MNLGSMNIIITTIISLLFIALFFQEENKRKIKIVKALIFLSFILCFTFSKVGKYNIAIILLIISIILYYLYRRE